MNGFFGKVLGVLRAVCDCTALLFLWEIGLLAEEEFLEEEDFLKKEAFLLEIAGLWYKTIVR